MKLNAKKFGKIFCRTPNRNFGRFLMVLPRNYQLLELPLINVGNSEVFDRNFHFLIVSYQNYHCFLAAHRHLLVANFSCYRSSDDSRTILRQALNHILTNTLTLTHTLTHTLKYTLTHALTHTLTHTITHTLTHTLAHTRGRIRCFC